MQRRGAIRNNKEYRGPPGRAVLRTDDRRGVRGSRRMRRCERHDLSQMATGI